jgi:hypothetical protein
MASLELNINQVNSDFNGIKNAITAKGVEIANGTATSEYADKVNEVYEAGKQDEYDRFWDTLQENGTRKRYPYAFGSVWTDSIFKPKYDITPTSLYGAFMQTSIVDLEECIKNAGIVFDTTNIDSGYLGKCFSESGFLKVIPEINATKCGIAHAFTSSSKVETIRKIILNDDGTSRVESAFTGCSKLKNVVFEGVIGADIAFGSCKLLTKESILSIFSCLSSTASGKTLTLNKTAVNNAFETASGTADGSTSEEWLNLVASKPNWTISLST